MRPIPAAIDAAVPELPHELAARRPTGSTGRRNSRRNRRAASPPSAAASAAVASAPSRIRRASALRSCNAARTAPFAGRPGPCTRVIRPNADDVMFRLPGMSRFSTLNRLNMAISNRSRDGRPARNYLPIVSENTVVPGPTSSPTGRCRTGRCCWPAGRSSSHQTIWPPSASRGFRRTSPDRAAASR